MTRFTRKQVGGYRLEVIEATGSLQPNTYNLTPQVAGGHA